jgi:hypothetical protein
MAGFPRQVSCRAGSGWQHEEEKIVFLKKITILLIAGMGVSFFIRVVGTIFPLIFRNMFIVKATILLNVIFILTHFVFWLVFYREYISKTKDILKEICIAAVVGSFVVLLIYMKKLPFVFGMNVQFPVFMINPYYDAVVPLIGSVIHLFFFIGFKKALTDDERTKLGRPVSSMIIGICVFILLHVIVLFNFITTKRFEWLEHMPRGFAVGTVPLIIAAVLLMLFFYYRFYRFLDSENSTENTESRSV